MLNYQATYNKFTVPQIIAQKLASTRHRLHLHVIRREKVELTYPITSCAFFCASPIVATVPALKAK